MDRTMIRLPMLMGTMYTALIEGDLRGWVEQGDRTLTPMH